MSTEPVPAEIPAKVIDQDEKTWAMVAHLGQLLGCISVLGTEAAFVLGFVIPVIVMLTAAKNSAYVRANAVEAVNFQITGLIVFAIGLLTALILIGFAIILVAALVWFVLPIVAAVKSYNGEPYRYGPCIRFLK